MSTTVSGSYAFEDIPTVNGQSVLLSGGGTGTITTGTFASRPAASTAGNLYIDTTNNFVWSDTGAAWVQLSTGTVLQTVSAPILRTTGTTLITTAATAAPTNTDGFQIWSQSFTPLRATSRILIHFNVMVSTNTATGIVTGSVFAGSTNIGTVATSLAVINTPYMLPFTLVYSPGSTSAITFTCRVGARATATISVQQYNGTTNTLGNAGQTAYVIQEIV